MKSIALSLLVPIAIFLMHLSVYSQKPDSICIAAFVFTQPNDQTVEIGTSATLSIIAHGTPPLTYLWYKNNQRMPEASGSSYTTPLLTAADNGNKYKCVVSNCNGNYQATSNSAKLIVICKPVSITNQPRDTTVEIGHSVRFHVQADGTPPLHYQWYRNNSLLSTDAHNSSYLINHVSQNNDNGAKFKCVVTNCDSTAVVASRTAMLNVICKPVSILTQPLDQTVESGGTATFSISVTGSPPDDPFNQPLEYKFSYKWYKNNQLVKTHESYAHTDVFTMQDLTAADNGKYKCVVSNCKGSGQATSNTVTLTVPCTVVSITNQPRDTTEEVGQSARFSIQVGGTPPFHFQWYRNNSLLSTDAHNSSYLINHVSQNNDNGAKFKCVVTNCDSTAVVTSRTATLNVTCKPVSILTQPLDQTEESGGTATFSISVTGSPHDDPFNQPLEYKFTYKWYKNNQLIRNHSGYSHTDNFTTKVLTAADNGSKYKCVVSNCKGSGQATSNTVTLTVTCNAVSISAQPKDQTAALGSTATFSISTNGNGPIIYKWYKNLGAGFVACGSGSSYTTPSLTVRDNNSTYWCVITTCDATHQITSNTATLTISDVSGEPGQTESTEKWVITPSKTKSTKGRLLMDFSKELTWSLDVYNEPGKHFLEVFYSSTPNWKPAAALTPGIYTIELNHVSVENIPITDSHDIRIRYGILSLPDQSCDLYDETGKIHYLYHAEAMKLGLPLGKYLLKIGRTDHPIEIVEGKIVEF